MGSLLSAAVDDKETTPLSSELYAFRLTGDLTHSIHHHLEHAFVRKTVKPESAHEDVALDGIGTPRQPATCIDFGGNGDDAAR